MDLLVDLGNTRIKWAWLAEGKLQQFSALRHREVILTDGLAEAFVDLPRPERVWLASVASHPTREEFIRWSEKKFQVKPTLLISPVEGQGIKNAYTEPHILGIDRWLAMIGARQHCKEDFCVIDCGTALTLDVVTAKGQHLGGCIAPGLEWMGASVQQITQGRLQFSGDFAAIEYPPLLNTDTQNAMKAGFHFGVLGFLRVVAQELRASYPNIHFLLSGGDAPRWQKDMNVEADYYPHLVLEGLALMVLEKSLDRVQTSDCE